MMKQRRSVIPLEGYLRLDDSFSKVILFTKTEFQVYVEIIESIINPKQKSDILYNFARFCQSKFITKTCLKYGHQRDYFNSWDNPIDFVAKKVSEKISYDEVTKISQKAQIVLSSLERLTEKDWFTQSGQDFIWLRQKEML